MMKKRQPLLLLRKLDIYLQKTETRSILPSCTSINSKWIKDLNMKSETLKLAQERAGNTLEAIVSTTKEMVFKLKRPLTE
jgi:hypothetical protein